MNRKAIILTFFLAGFFSLKAQESEFGSLADALRSIERRFNVKFAYDYQLANSRTIKLPDLSEPLIEILESTLTVNGFTYEMGRRVIMVAPEAVNPNEVEEVELELSGVIRDASSGEPLSNAAVVILENNQYTTTNPEGYFVINNIPSESSSIEVNYLGYQSKVFSYYELSGDNNPVLTLAPDPEMLDAVIVEEETPTFNVSDEVGKISINPAKVQLYSSLGQPDIIRSIQLLPGVVGTSESSSGLTVRGGGPDQNLVLFDGFSVFNIDHFFGTLSAFNSNVVRDASLYKSGFGTRYGGRVSSVLDIESRDGTFGERPRGSVGVDLMSANVSLETALSDRVSILLAGRRSYSDVFQTNVFKNVVDNIKENRPDAVSNFVTNNFVRQVEPQFNYYDVNAKVKVDLSSREELSLSFYNSNDRLKVSDLEQFVDPENDVSFNQEYNETTQWGNTGLSINYSRQWSPVFTSKLILANSSSFRKREVDFLLDFRNRGRINFQDINRKDKNSISESALKLDNQYLMSRNASLEFGAFIINNRIEYYNLLNLSVEDLSLIGNGNQFGVYVQQNYSPLPNLTVTGGLRGTYYSGADNNYLEPRVSLSYSPHPTFSLKGSLGRYYQFVSQANTNNPFLSQESFWLVADGINVATVGSNHFVSGFTYNSKIVTVDVEAYYKTLEGLTAYSADSSSVGNLNASGQFGALYRGSGRVRGMDVNVKKEFGNFHTMLSYSLSSVRHRFFNLNEGKEFDANQDQRHELKWVSSITAGRWEFSSTFVYGSGRPYTGFPFEIGQRVLGEDIIDQLFRGGSETNNLRVPAYHRLDLGMSYSMNFGKYTDGQIGLNFFNLYNHTNIKEIRYDLDFNINNQTLVVSERRLQLLEFTPSIYFNFYF